MTMKMTFALASLALALCSLAGAQDSGRRIVVPARNSSRPRKVVAHSLNAMMKVTMDSVDPAKPLSFTTMNGTIDVTLPADYKGNVKMSSHNGAIYTDFEFRLGGGTITQSNNTPDGKFIVGIG